MAEITPMRHRRSRKYDPETSTRAWEEREWRAMWIEELRYLNQVCPDVEDPPEPWSDCERCAAKIYRAFYIDDHTYCAMCIDMAEMLHEEIVLDLADPMIHII